MIAEFDKSEKRIKIAFDGVDDLMEYGTKFRKPDCPQLLKSEAESFSEVFTEQNHWNGMKNMEMVEADLLKPTPETAANLKTSQALFDSEDWATEKPKRKLHRRLEDGDEIDIDRWRDREPDMWEETRKTKGMRFGVRIGVNVATSAAVEKEGFKWRTSTIIAMLSIVEELNIPCEVMCYEHCTGAAALTYDGNRYFGCKLEVSFPVKRPEHLLDVDLLAYVLGDQSFFRVGILGAEIMAMKDKVREDIDIDHGLGMPREKDNADPNEFILSRACITKKVAEQEMERFKKWLIAIKQKAQYGIDEQADANYGNPFAGLM